MKDVSPGLKRRDGRRFQRAACLFVIIFLFFGITNGGGQETGAVQPAQSQLPVSTPIPKTYTGSPSAKTEKKPGEKLWRIAIIGAGTFPIALFYTNFIFDSVRFAANGFDAQYAPWPFKNQYSATVEIRKPS